MDRPLRRLITAEEGSINGNCPNFSRAHAFVGRTAPPGREEHPCIGAFAPLASPPPAHETLSAYLCQREFEGEEAGKPTGDDRGAGRCRGSAARCTAPWRRAAVAAPSSPAPSAPPLTPSSVASTMPARLSRAAPGSSPYRPTS